MSKPTRSSGDGRCPKAVVFMFGPPNFCTLGEGHEGMHELEDGFRWLDVETLSSSVSQEPK